MKLNLNFNLKALNGEDVPGKDTAGMILGAYLSQTNKNNAIKLWDWALKLYRNEEIELDQTDTEMLVSLIETSEALTVLAKAQLMNAINSAKNTSDLKRKKNE